MLANGRGATGGVGCRVCRTVISDGGLGAAALAGAQAERRRGRTKGRKSRAWPAARWRPRSRPLHAPFFPAVAEVMVQMECDYVTPSFFRELERAHQLEAAAAGSGTGPAGQGEDRLAQLAAGNVDADADDDSDGDTEPSPGAAASRGQSFTSKPGESPPAKGAPGGWEGWWVGRWGRGACVCVVVVVCVCVWGGGGAVGTAWAG